MSSKVWRIKFIDCVRPRNEKTGWTLVIGKGSSSKPTEIFSAQGSDLIQLSQHGQAIANLEFGSGVPLFLC